MGNVKIIKEDLWEHEIKSFYFKLTTLQNMAHLLPLGLDFLYRMFNVQVKEDLR